MIEMTDNLYELRKFMFEEFIKMGYKYIARDKDGAIFAYSSKPTKKNKVWILDSAPVNDTYQNISLISRMFTDVKWGDKKPFEIPCVNWDDVPVDTKVIVTGVHDSKWKCHFCEKLNDKILVFRDGKTSWTTNDVVEVDIDNVRLA